jgi:NADH:ubiquinone oxidoreductase subunit 6 (subunit J)
MSFKTIIIIVLAVLITVIFMQNTDQVMFTLLWKEIYVSKLIMMLIVTVFGFIIGVIVARPKRKKKEVVIESNTPNQITNTDDESYVSMKKQNDLSDEDRDYIN